MGEGIYKQRHSRYYYTIYILKAHIMDEDIRNPDKAFMDTLYSNTTNQKATRRRKQKARVIKNTNTFYQPHENTSQNRLDYKHEHQDTHEHPHDNEHYNEHEDEDELKLAEEQLLQHVINMSLKDTHINTILYTNIELDNSPEKLRTIQNRQSLFTHSQKLIYRLNIMDKTEQLYQNILLYITQFVQSGENIHISIQEKENIQNCLNHIRLTQSDRQHILDIFTLL